MNAELSPNTQAILLLTAPLLVGKGKSPARPLITPEYGKLAQSLRAAGREPADLLISEERKFLPEVVPGFDSVRVSQLLERGFLLSQALELWRARDIWVVSRADPEYPQRFKKRLGNVAPPALYGCGDANLLNSGGLAVVGSRDAGEACMEYADRVGRLAASAQRTVISGGARGVDQAAMRGVLSEWGVAIGVLGDRLGKAVLDRGNRDALMDGRLVLISPYDPEAGFNVGNLMQRNKLVYALADAGLVVESDYRKGGTWEGAVEQLDKLRLVPIYTRSQGEVGRGLKALQRKGAMEWPNPQTPDEFSQVMAGLLLPQKSDAASQGALFPEHKEEPQSLSGDVVNQNAAPDSINNHNAVAEMPPGDALFAKAEELLNAIETPLQDADVAEYLQITKRQAQEWLQRLVQEGKYRKQTRPTRYTKII